MPARLMSPAIYIRDPYSYVATSLFLVLEIHFHRAGKLDGQRIAVAVPGLAGLDFDPALADAVFGDVGLFDALEADADVALQKLGVVIRALWIVGEPVRQSGSSLRFGHVFLLI